MELLTRFLADPGRSFFLFGPRGTGKSTWCRETFPDALHIDLLEPDTARRYQARPERLGEIVEGNRGREIVIVDEIQRVPEMLSVVHSLTEKRRKLRFVLTGSSARKLRRGGVNLLGGRAVRCVLHPFMASELGSLFNLKSALRFGTVPVVAASPDPGDTLRGYVGLYLREEVQAEGLTRNMGAFSRFLEAVSFSHGNVLNTSNVARECEVERKTVEGYLQVLEDLLLAFRLPVFTRRVGRRLAAHPKLYLFDTGVYRALRPSGPMDRAEETEGAALEGLVAQHLRAWVDYRAPDSRLYYWRTASGVEVDFVVYGPDGFWAVEVKNSVTVRPDSVKGLLSFHEEYPESKTILLYRGSERLVYKGVHCIPCDQFLQGLKPRKPLS